MMENHEFCDNCPGCRPAILSLQSGQKFPDDSPMMIEINKIWDTQTTFEQRKAFIECTLKNSENPENIRLTQEVVNKFHESLEKMENSFQRN